MALWVDGGRLGAEHGHCGRDLGRLEKTEWNAAEMDGFKLEWGWGKNARGGAVRWLLRTGQGQGRCTGEEVADGAEMAGAGGQLSGRRTVIGREEAFGLKVQSFSWTDGFPEEKEVVGKGEAFAAPIGKACCAWASAASDWLPDRP